MNSKPKTIAYIDPFNGASGDMLLGAFLDLGFPLEKLEEAIRGMGLPGCSLKASRLIKKGIRATKFDVLLEKLERKHNHLKDIVEMIGACKASSGAKELALKIFRKIAEAEALVHGTTPEKIHFHEVGAVDSIVDILGAAMAFDYFGFDSIISAPLNIGSGTVKCDHGVLPVPAPAVVELLKGIPSFSSGVQRELTTPTGAAILGVVVSSFAQQPLMEIQEVGYGAGTADLDTSPNVLRIITGAPIKSSKEEHLVEMEANIDDMNPEYYEHVMDRLFKAGALDVFMTPIIMKKSRPAVKLSVICNEGLGGEVRQVLFNETSTFGIRQWEVTRSKLERKIQTVETEYGPVEVKFGAFNGGQVQLAPEYESCLKIAREKGIPLKTIFDVAREEGRKVKGKDFM